MTDRIIEVLGMGNIAFPDTMSDNAIALAIKNNILKQPGKTAGRGKDGTPRLKGTTDKMSLPAPVRAFAGAGSELTNLLTVGGRLAPEGATDAMQPDTTAGKVGKMGEQVAEFAALPASGGVWKNSARMGALETERTGSVKAGAQGTAAALLTGGLASGVGAGYRALNTAARKAAVGKAAEDLPYGIGKIIKFVHSFNKPEDIPKETRAELVKRLYEEAHGGRPQSAQENVTAIKEFNAAVKETKPPKLPLPGKGTGTKYGGPARPGYSPPAGKPTRQGVNRAMEPKAPAAAEGSATATATPTGTPVKPEPPQIPAEPGEAAHLRSRVLMDRGAAKNSYLANRFLEAKMTPEQVETMSDAAFEMEMLKEGQALVKRGMLKRGYKKYTEGDPAARPYKIMKIEVADTMRRAGK